MDIWKALHELHLERQRLDQVIGTLEALKSGEYRKPPSRRGRKSMPTHERHEVSERMKRYWAMRRQGIHRSDSSARATMGSAL